MGDFQSMIKDCLETAFDLIDGARDQSKIMGHGASDAEITAAETVLGIQFPQEYRRFLSRYGYGGVGGFEIFGLPHDEPEEPFPYPHVVQLNEEMRESGLSARILAFKVAGNGEAYGLDLSNSINPHVVVFWPGDPGDAEDHEIVDDTFGEHLLSEIERVRSRLDDM